MRINTITFVHTRNVGAALQATALYKYLAEEGYEVQVVDYRPEFFESQERLICFDSIPLFIKSVCLYPINFVTRLKFERFIRKNIELTSVCRTTLDIQNLEQPDVFIVGSDQVWNKAITNWDSGFFLDFDSTAGKISYAGSVGQDVLDDAEMAVLKEKLRRVDFLSVRELELKRQLENFGIDKVSLVLDPVFLLDKQFYISKLKKKVDYKYVLLYETTQNEQCFLTARMVADQLGCKIVQMNRIINKYKADKILPSVSPEDFLSLIYYSDFVVTNSFHGTALSIVLEKSFYSVRLNERNSRIDSILSELKLTNRMISNKEDVIPGDLLIEYEKVSSLLKTKINKSKTFLSTSLSSIQEKNKILSGR